MTIVLLTHDLACTVEELMRAAANYPRGELSALPPLPRRLVIAAVTFTVQLAIDTTDQDPTLLRELEQALISKLEPPPASTP